MSTHPARALSILAAVAIAASVLVAPSPALGQATEWTFRVAADPAVVRAQPDAASPRVESLAKGTTVKSYAAEGAWIRCIIARPDGSVVIGYVAASDLELVDSKAEEAADFWTDPGDAYHGAGFVFRFSGGLGTIGSGDILKGTDGHFQNLIEYLESYPGYEYLRETPLSFRTRNTFGGELLYHLSPRFGLGLGVSYASSHAYGEKVYMKFFPIEAKVNIDPKITTLAYSVIASYLLPLNKILSLRLSGGPMLAHVRYLCQGTSPVLDRFWSTLVDVSAMGLGAHATAALELNLNERGAIFIELAGRAASIRGFEGRHNNNFMYYNGTSEIIRVEGTLYAVETDNRTRLEALADTTQAPEAYRKAGYNLMGVDARFGFKIRF